MERNTTGGRIETARKKAGLTQKEVAEALHVKRETVYQWESDERQIKSSALIGLAGLFRVSVDYLLGLSKFETPSAELRAICEATGLNEDSIQTLDALRHLSPRSLDFINAILLQSDSIIKAMEAVRRSAESAIIADAHPDAETEEKNNILAAAIASAGATSFLDGTIDKSILADATTGVIRLSATEAGEWYLSRAQREGYRIIESAIDTVLLEAQNEDT